MIEIKDLHFSYRQKIILNGLNLTVNQGDCIGIVGANGCGKTTLLSILGGVQKPKSGSVFYLDKQIKKIGYVPQENPLLDELTVLDNLRIWYDGTFSDLMNLMKKGLYEALQLEGILKIPVHKLSGGMKRKVGIAIALLNSPSILLLDEPSVALDLPTKAEIRTYLSLFIVQGGTILLTSHEESELSLCTKLFVLKKGILQEVPHTLRGEALVRQL